MSLILGLLACGGRDGSGGSARAEARPAYVDSGVPREVSLARFREGLADPGRLEGGAKSRDELLRRYVEALERRDTMVLVGMTITRAEFAYLYYRTGPEARPPYDLDPGLFWFMLQQNSRKGLLRALDDRGGRPLGYLGYTCDDEPSQHRSNTVWGPCLVRRVPAPGDTVVGRLFGPIVEREGRFKFLSYGNKL
ncbi:MAG: hypothetical protein HYV20_09705 [Gemmatimonadetes bacterium]|nr:hypothetical protein [Gemmatimonadota bacterium]